MPAQVTIPLSVLLCPDLTPATKLVWMGLQLESDLDARTRESPSRLQRLVGVTRPTVRRALKRLREEWHPQVSQDDTVLMHTVVDVDTDLITDKAIPGIARVLYPVLRALALRAGTNELSSYAEIAQVVHLQPRTVRLAIRKLVDAGWLAISQTNQRAPIQFSFPNPKVVREQAELRRIRQRLGKSKAIGETLAMLWCDYLIDDSNFREDDFPKSFVNPKTNQALQADRFYIEHRVAIEFNGPQHDGATRQYSEEEAKKQIARDKLKREICQRQKIPLITLRPEDLTFKRLRSLLGSVLPMSDLSETDAIVGLLERESRDYLQAINHIRRQAASSRRGRLKDQQLKRTA